MKTFVLDTNKTLAELEKAHAKVGEYLGKVQGSHEYSQHVNALKAIERDIASLRKLPVSKARDKLLEELAKHLDDAALMFNLVTESEILRKEISDNQRVLAELVQIINLAQEHPESIHDPKAKIFINEVLASKEKFTFPRIFGKSD